MKKYIYRSAITGKIVSEKYAKSHLNTTVKERLPDRNNQKRLKRNREIINSELRALSKPLI